MGATKTPKITPMLRQYLAIKEQHPDAILFFRMGDFYEMFFDDAVTASRVLDITLTSRSHKNDAEKVPMCGVPYHAVSSYLGKMIKAGHKVALCEQTEDPKKAKGLVRREVTRIVTPGVTTDDQVLDSRSNCFVCGLSLQRHRKNNLLAGLAFLDVSTGSFQTTELTTRVEDLEPVIEILATMEPAELLCDEEDKQVQPILEHLSPLLPDLCITRRPPFFFDPYQARTLLLEHFRTTNLAGFGCEDMAAGITAAGSLLAYIQETQKQELSHIRRLQPLRKNDALIIDEASRRNLELTETIIAGKRQGSLLSVLDACHTPMGSRLLRQRLLFPLQDRMRIQARLDSVQLLLSKMELRNRLATLLERIHDVERLCSRLSLGHGNGRDMVAMKHSLALLPEIRSCLQELPAGLLRDIGTRLDVLADIHQLLAQAINDDPPATLREGNLIKAGYNQTLDDLLHLLRDGKDMILALEEKERKRTGIPKMKVGYNRVFGYYFEVSKSHHQMVPDSFIRKQTLVNAERFITPELKELENRITTAEEKRLELEYRLFCQIRDQISQQAARILETANQIARIDFLVGLAEVACQRHYVKPEITSDRIIAISEGRHPVIEQALEPGRFVPNDILLNQQDQELLIITGPNMAGKSTILRQTGLIVLMAHLGSFVPASQAKICLVDRIFTRVGAMDDLRRGQSTFMVEMNETANILNNATDRSLVILDEIGRGTSTYDGLAIAWAVAEDLVQKNGRGIKTLFATHYHELTTLAAEQERIKNFSIAVREWNDQIIFLHKLVAGATSRSYGIQVAALAGVPKRVITRAHTILRQIEAEKPKALSPRHPSPGRPWQLSLFPLENDQVQTLFAEIDPDALSPREALDLVYKAVALVQKQETS